MANDTAHPHRHSIHYDLKIAARAGPCAATEPAILIDGCAPSAWMSRWNLAWRSVAVWGALAALFVLTSCTAMNSEPINIRIQNATDTDITAFWLGAGSGAGGPGSRAYGAIARGQTTPYRRLKAQFGSYSNYNYITEDGQRFVGSTVANELIGQVVLEPGYYTLVYTVVDNKVIVTINHDEAQ